MTDVILWVLVLWWIPPVIFLMFDNGIRRDKKRGKQNDWNPKEY